MKTLFQLLVLQIQFFTRIPVPFTVEWSERKFVQGIPFYPLIGAGLGAIAALVMNWFSPLELPVLSAIVTITVLTVLGGGLHLDGLADTADGFFSGRDRERTLEIMKDSRIGTNGTIALILVFALKSGALLSLENALIPLICASLFARISMICAAAFSSYARTDSGMGKYMISHTGKKTALFSTLVALTFALILFSHQWKVVLIFCGVAVLGGLAMALYSTKKIGGTTGDVLGAQVELMETTLLILAPILMKLFAQADLLQ